MGYLPFLSSIKHLVVALQENMELLSSRCWSFATVTSYLYPTALFPYLLAYTVTFHFRARSGCDLLKTFWRAIKHHIHPKKVPNSINVMTAGTAATKFTHAQQWPQLNRSQRLPANSPCKIPLSKNYRRFRVIKLGVKYCLELMKYLCSPLGHPRCMFSILKVERRPTVKKPSSLI